jgi:hypothetical protein
MLKKKRMGPPVFPAFIQGGLARDLIRIKA